MNKISALLLLTGMLLANENIWVTLANNELPKLYKETGMKGDYYTTLPVRPDGVRTRKHIKPVSEFSAAAASWGRMYEKKIHDLNHWDEAVLFFVAPEEHRNLYKVPKWWYYSLWLIEMPEHLGSVASLTYFKKYYWFERMETEVRPMSPKMYWGMINTYRALYEPGLLTPMYVALYPMIFSLYLLVFWLLWRGIRLAGGFIIAYFDRS